MSEDKRAVRLEERRVLLEKLKRIADRPKDFVYVADDPDQPHKPATNWHDKDGA